MLVLLVLLIVLALAGPLLGADSRDGRDWSPADPEWPAGRRAPGKRPEPGSRQVARVSRARA